MKSRGGTTTGASLQLSVDATAESVKIVRHSVAEVASVAGADEAAVHDISLAVNEAMSNAVRHAYPARDGPVDVFVERSGSHLAVVVRDEGRGFSIAGRRSEPGNGGLGLPLIEALTEEYTIHSRPKRGTEIHMVFPLRGQTPRGHRLTVV